MTALLEPPPAPAVRRQLRPNVVAPARPVRRRRRWVRRVVAAVLVLLLLPVPWRHHVGEQPAAFAWRLDGRLHVDGQLIDPPGQWSWLTVGRPPLVGELLWRRAFSDDVPRDLRNGPAISRPQVSEPIAAAAALAAAGRPVPMQLLFEASEPTVAGLPEQAVLTRLNGIDLHSRDDYRRALDRPRRSTWFWTDEREHFQTDGLDLPYRRLRIVDIPPDELTAQIGGDNAAVSWLRGLSTGNSHGLIVALTIYAEISGDDLARGRHIAGTGRIAGDGTVGRISGLEAKARAARRAGADVLVFPAEQAHELAGFDAGGMQLVGVDHLDDAIAALASAHTSTD